MNVIVALADHLDSEIAETRAASDEAMQRYVALRRRVSELESLRDLRAAIQAADVTPVTESTPLRSIA